MKYLLIVTLIVILSGCAITSYTKGDISVSHMRLFATADSIEAKVGDAEVKTNGQKIDSEALGKFLSAIGALK